ncbi:MAG: hypothetical protein RXQ95_01755 [Vulcanisaeta sp.]
MAKRYLALAMLASALWGVSYPITYLALRLYGIEQLLASIYLFSTASLAMILAFNGFDRESVVKGLALSPINYALSYLYVELSGSVGGLTALVSSSYIIPLIVIDYLLNRDVSIKYVISAVTLLAGLYLLFQGYGDSIYIAMLLMILNLAYTLALAYLSHADTLNLILGQSLGTLLISLFMVHGAIITSNIQYIYYPLALAFIGNVIPYSLYAVSIEKLGPVEASLTSSMETVSSLVVSIPIQQLPNNPLAWTLLTVSILSISIEAPRFGVHGKTLAPIIRDYINHNTINSIRNAYPRHINRDDMRDSPFILNVPGKRKVI